MFFSKTTGLIVTRLITNHPWGKRIQVSSNEGGGSSSRGDDNERIKVH
jgi:hypothetical protein